ncbi:MAG: hypothetical protein HQL80_08395 [Magnetococcales bacterium]|nr:hypothetical protein [Magnetococcales bacterium]MBF0584237.1 hypothetical protein [Magnetococcales bacterium]
MNTEETGGSYTRRHGNGLLDRISVRAMPNGLRTPALHVRNRWSSLKPTVFVPFNRTATTLWSEKAGV